MISNAISITWYHNSTLKVTDSYDSYDSPCKVGSEVVGGGKGGGAVWLGKQGRWWGVGGLVSVGVRGGGRLVGAGRERESERE